LGYIFSHRKGPLGSTPVTSIHSELWPRYSPINILRPAKFGPCRFFFRSPCLCRRRRSSEFCDFSGQAIRSCFCSGHGPPSCQSHACTGSVGDHTSPRSIPKSSPCCSYPNPVPKLAKRKVPTGYTYRAAHMRLNGRTVHSSGLCIGGAASAGTWKRREMGERHFRLMDGRSIS
jgi:hypothetical protein